MEGRPHVASGSAGFDRVGDAIGKHGVCAARARRTFIEAPVSS